MESEIRNVLGQHEKNTYVPMTLAPSPSINEQRR